MDKKTAHLTHEGIAKAQEFAGVGSFYVGANMEWPHLMEQALRAHVCFVRDKDYVVEKQSDSRFSDIVIVDEFTGRKMQGRQWSEGLHQAIEAKEKVAIKQETQTLATITLQNFFKLYKALSGMTGLRRVRAGQQPDGRGGNIGIGWDAGATLDASNLTGNNNTALGYDATSARER